MFDGFAQKQLNFEFFGVRDSLSAFFHSFLRVLAPTGVDDPTLAAVTAALRANRTIRHLRLHAITPGLTPEIHALLEGR